MCHLPFLPSLDEVIASMEQEEIRQKVMTGEATPVVRPALVVPAAPAREDRECYNCGNTGGGQKLLPTTQHWTRMGWT
jgi:hypothetical protein